MRKLTLLAVLAAVLPSASGSSYVYLGTTSLSGNPVMLDVRKNIGASAPTLIINQNPGQVLNSCYLVVYRLIVGYPYYVYLYGTGSGEPLDPVAGMIGAPQVLESAACKVNLEASSLGGDSYGDDIHLNVEMKAGYTGAKQIFGSWEETGWDEQWQEWYTYPVSETLGSWNSGGTVSITMEGEAGSLAAPMAAAGDLLAAGEAYVATSVTNMSSPSGTATYAVSIPQAGNYVMWARVLAANGNSDSFFVLMDGVSDIFDSAWNVQGPNWQWSRVNARGGGLPDTINPRVFNLSAGNHTLVFGGREAGARLDRFVITNDMGWVPDGTAPSITSGPAVTNISASGATISWSTNEASDTQVEYGITTAYGLLSALNSSMVTGHGVNLTGLSAGTTYYYRVRSRDAASNLGTQAGGPFTTQAAPDTTAPAISGVGHSGITSSSATITWTTNEVSDTQVEYGTTTAYGVFTALNSSMVASHAANLTGLMAGTAYYYRVRSRDGAGNLGTQAGGPFTTQPGAPVSITLEGESGTIVSPMAAGQDPLAAGGAYIATSVANMSSSSGTATYTVNIQQAGSYIMWARVLAATGTSDSFFVVMDGATDIFDAAWGVQGPNWQWSRVNARGGGSPDAINPRLFVLGAGNHTLVFGGREADARLDRFVITSDLGWTPDGTSPSISSGPGVTGITTSGATISWSTNEAADTQVEYGTTTAYGLATVLDASPVTSHVVTLSGLASGTSYYYRVKSRDGGGNLVMQAGGPFTTAVVTTVTQTITTVPSGRSLTVDGVPRTSPCTFQWTPGSTHTVATTAIQPGATGVQYVFATWSDAGAISHTITAPSSDAFYTASFTTQYYVTTAAAPPEGGTISPASGWYNSGAVVAVSASTNGGWHFSGFGGALGGTATPQNLSMNGPLSVTSNYTEDIFGTPQPSVVFRETATAKVKLVKLGATVASDSGGTFAGTPVSAKNAIGDTYVTALDSSGAPWVNVYMAASQTWLGWQTPGGIYVGKPAIVVGANGTAYACYRDSAGQFRLINYRQGVGFGAVQNLGGTFVSDPVMGAAPDGSVYVAGSDSAHSVWAGRLNTAIQFGGWIFLGGSMWGNPALAVGGDNAAYLVANNGSSIAWMGRLVGSTWSGWFTTAMSSWKDPAITATAAKLFVSVVATSGAVWTCTMAIGNRVCGEWTNRGQNVQSVSASGEGSDAFLATRDVSGNGLWYRLSTNQWTQDGPDVSPGSPLTASYVTPRAVVLIDPPGDQCGDSPYYYNAVEQDGPYAWTEAQTWVEGYTAAAWGVGLNASVKRNGADINPEASRYFSGVANNPETGRAFVAIVRQAVYRLQLPAARYKQTAIHSWDGSAVNCSVIGNPITSTYERDLPVSSGTPFVSAISPSSATLAQTVDITVSGSNLSTATDVVFANGNGADPAIGFTATLVSASQIQGTLNIGADAQPGNRSVYVTSPFGNSNSVNFTVQGDSTPYIDSITPSSLDAGAVNVPVTIIGGGFGTRPTISIDGQGVSGRIDPAVPPTDTQIAARFDATQEADSSVNVSVNANGTDMHNFAPNPGAQQQSNQKPVNVVPNSDSSIAIEYRAFIRANWARGPFDCVLGISQPFISGTPMYARGDNRDFNLAPRPLTAIPPSNPFRVTEKIFVYPNLGYEKTYYGDQGTSRMYDAKSLKPDVPPFDPAGSGQILDPTIIDMPRTCNGGRGVVKKGKDVPNLSPATVSRDPGSGEVTISFAGEGFDVNVLGSLQFGPIRWNLTITISGDGSTATITGTHTCFPAHEVVINGKYLWRYGPNYGSGNPQNPQPDPVAAAPSLADNDGALLKRCLTGELSLIPVSGQINLR